MALKPDFNIHIRHQKEEKEKEYMILAKSFISPGMLIASGLMVAIQQALSLDWVFKGRSREMILTLECPSGSESNLVPANPWRALWGMEGVTREAQEERARTVQATIATSLPRRGAVWGEESLRAGSHWILIFRRVQNQSWVCESIFSIITQTHFHLHPLLAPLLLICWSWILLSVVQAALELTLQPRKALNSRIIQLSIHTVVITSFSQQIQVILRFHQQTISQVWTQDEILKHIAQIWWNKFLVYCPYRVQMLPDAYMTEGGGSAFGNGR